MFNVSIVNVVLCFFSVFLPKLINEFLMYGFVEKQYFILEIRLTLKKLKIMIDIFIICNNHEKYENNS